MFFPGIGALIVSFFGYTKMVKPSFVKLYALILLLIFGGIVIHAPLSVGLGALFPGHDLLIKSWKEILLVLVSPVALWVVLQQKKVQELLQDRILQVAVLYILLHVVTAAALLTGPLATLAGLAIDLRYIVFFVLIYVLLKLSPHYRRRFLQVGVIGAAIVIGFGVLQLFLPKDILAHIGYGANTIQPYLTVDKNPNYIRINSTLRGPNPLGAYIVIVFGLLVAALVRGRINLQDRKNTLFVSVAALASAAVLWVTYSRSALIGVAVAIGIVVAVASRRLLSRRVWIAGTIVVFALAGASIAGRDQPFVTNVLLHENRNGGSQVSSNEGHAASLETGTKSMLRQPIGTGIGSTGSASLLTNPPLIIENQYLFIAHEVGWFGLVLFVALFLLILIKLWHGRRDYVSLGVFASGVGLGLIGIIQPVWVDDTVSIIWWGLAAIALGSRSKNGR